MGLDAGVPIEVHNAVDDWVEKYRKRQEQGQLCGRSHVKKRARHRGTYRATAAAT